MEKKMNIVLFGPPGAGKGTQSENLINKYGWVHLSTGDILRTEINRGTDLGKKAKDIMDRGELVSDEIVIGMIESKLDQNTNSKGFIFDGFPRTKNQAIALDDLLQKKGTGISAMLALEVNDDELFKRLLNRGKESGRADDQNEEIIKRRISEYNNKTLPLKNYYTEQGKFHSIDGIGTIEEIFKSIVDRINFLYAELDLTALETDLEHLDMTVQDFEEADDIAPELLLEIDAIKRIEAEEAEEHRVANRLKKQSETKAKSVAKKVTPKKAIKKLVAKKKVAPKLVNKKAASKKAPVKKTAAKKVVKKIAAKKIIKKISTNKKVVHKAASKKVASKKILKKISKPIAKKAVAKKIVAKKIIKKPVKKSAPKKVIQKSKRKK